MLLELEPEKDEIRRANRHKPLVANTCTLLGFHSPRCAFPVKVTRRGDYSTLPDYSFVIRPTSE
jgi:hypothetical protein